jgi:membrane protein DedA with SNARE-associated domain
MPPEIITFITEYGYWAIFILVFSQEVGIPNPIPNELVLLFSGYLAYQHTMNFFVLIGMVVSADFCGTMILYFLFYYFGKKILNKIPSWFPISKTKLETLQEKYASSGLWTIYLGRVTPFIRGYTSISAGLLKIKPTIFIPLSLITASLWAVVGVGSGYYFHNYWERIGTGFLKYRIWFFAIIGIAILYYIITKFVLKKETKSTL